MATFVGSRHSLKREAAKLEDIVLLAHGQLVFTGNTINSLYEIKCCAEMVRR